MNSYFSGAKFELAERYSDATKVIFVALFYAAILPESLFLGAIALLAHYWSGKFCLLRLWRATPDIGPHLARVSRNYFFSTTLIVHVVMSASDRVICLNGHVCCEGTPEVVSAAPEYRQLFGTGTKGALALYRHDHDHGHDHDHPHCHHEDAH